MTKLNDWLNDSGGGIIPNWMYVAAGIALVAGLIAAWL